jgi:hypothetical protein
MPTCSRMLCFWVAAQKRWPCPTEFAIVLITKGKIIDRFQRTDSTLRCSPSISLVLTTSSQSPHA